MTNQGSSWGGSSEWSETGALQKSPQVDDWLAIRPDGKVLAFSGRVELGTGVRTALAQIVAEELDVPFERVQMTMGDTALTPDEGYTAGSMTIQYGGFALRHACAEARRVLLEKASDTLDASPEELVVRQGIISVRDDPARAISYADLMGGKRFERKITLKAPLKRPEEYTIVGQPLRRTDLPGKITGTPSFIQDFRLPGMLHARVVRPPSPRARIAELDSSLVQEAQMVRLGDFVGVVASREEQAVRAAKQVRIRWNETAHLPPMEDLFEELRGQPATEEIVEERGDVQAALARAAQRWSATYYQPFQAHASLGPSCAVASFHDDQVEVWCNSRGVYPLRRALADLLKLPVSKVRVTHIEGAGSYGQNGTDDAAADAAVLSRAVGQPVRVQWSREDEFTWEPYAPAMIMEIHAGLSRKGKVVAWDYHAWSPTHVVGGQAGIFLLAGQLISGKAPPPIPFFFGGARNAPTNYSFRHQRVTMHWISNSILRASSFRSLGGSPNTFANESFMDELAAAAHTDPLEFRLRHLKDPRGREVLETAARQARWDTALGPGEGQGIAYAQYENEEAYVATVARVEVDPATGRVLAKRLVVAHDCGLVINPDGLRNQIEGNAIQSTSRALKEQVTFDQQHITSIDWETYPTLKFTEVPEVEVVLLNRPDEPALGAGEPASITTAAALSNAIFNATGGRVRQIPFTPERVRAAIEAGLRGNSQGRDS
ncbi:MAG: molybdopterin cofactor-binding domain-containing protein [Anaerolineales bacterium]|jgi:CO/xanthine dehydrogenase Mo-binding subunit